MVSMTLTLVSFTALRWFIVLSSVLLVIASAAAQPTPTAVATYKTAADIPVSEFFRQPRYSQMAMSPDGKRLAALAPINGRDNLVIIDLEKRASTTVTRLDYVDVADFLWLNDQRLFFRTSDRQLETGVQQRYSGYFAIDIDGSNARNLSPDKKRLRIFAVARDGSGDLIVAKAVDSRTSETVLRINTRTGRSGTLTYKNPGDVTDWAIDRSGAVRAAQRLEPRESPDKPRRQTLWYRQGADDDWQQIGAFSDERSGIRPLAFDGDNQSLIVATRGTKDRTALYRYDVAQKKLGELLYEHPWLDIASDLIRHPATGDVLGVKFSAEIPSVRWFDARYADMQRAIDQALPNTVNTLSPGRDDAAFFVVFAQSATDAGTYYLFDIKKLSLEHVATAREWLPSALMPERRFVSYKTRDGLTIPAWLTVPRGVDAKNLPLIVNIHGGPWVRSFHGVQWGRWPTAQFFASRGYAVLEPEPRGSVGFGAKHYFSSFKQWGLAMQDDITDGALYLANVGIVDKSRMCLFGGSYGGYASLQGVVKDPDLWRCASSYVAVTDLELLQSVSWSDTARLSDYFDTDFKRRVGDREVDRAQFDATSPAKNASKIKAAVMLTMGGQDQRVPIIHGTTMRDAMDKAGKPLDFTVYNEEGHGFNAPANVVDFYTRTERFFAKHLK
jgi:dipeptidyl aminopeptidase/acylaminoacyl peptidase